MTDFQFYFFLLLFVVAFLYSTVGHGGASGYLALMAIFSFSPATMRPTALILNILVSFIAFLQYYKRGYFKWDLFWPFALASVPAAFLGGMIHVDADLFKKILAILLLFSVVNLLGVKFQSAEFKWKQTLIGSLIIGMGIGIFSGMIGIGGGIILSPVLLLLHWAEMKETAAVSALFIFVNSIAGFAGLIMKGIDFDMQMGWMVMLAFAGGITGSYFGSKVFKGVMLNKLLAMVLLIAAIKLFFT